MESTTLVHLILLYRDSEVVISSICLIVFDATYAIIFSEEVVRSSAPHITKSSSEMAEDACVSEGQKTGRTIKHLVVRLVEIYCLDPCHEIERHRSLTFPQMAYIPFMK